MLQLSPMLSNTLLSRHQWLELAKAPFGCLARQPGWASNNSGISLTMAGETGWTSDHHNLSPPLLALHLSRLQDTQSIHVQAESWMSPQPSHGSACSPALHPGTTELGPCHLERAANSNRPVHEDTGAVKRPSPASSRAWPRIHPQHQEEDACW